MNGLQIEFLLGLFFFVTGLASLVDGSRKGAVVIFVSGLLLLVLVFVGKTLLPL